MPKQNHLFSQLSGTVKHQTEPLSVYMSRIHIVSQRVTSALLNSINNYGKKLKEGEKKLSLVTLFLPFISNIN